MRRKLAVDAVRHGSFKDASVILAAYEEMKRFVLLDRKGGAGGIEAIGAQRAFLAVRRGIEEMARNISLAAREPEPRCRYVRNRWNHASMIKIGKAFVQ